MMASTTVFASYHIALERFVSRGLSQIIESVIVRDDMLDIQGFLLNESCASEMFGQLVSGATLARYLDERLNSAAMYAHTDGLLRKEFVSERIGTWYDLVSYITECDTPRSAEIRRIIGSKRDIGISMSLSKEGNLTVLTSLTDNDRSEKAAELMGRLLDTTESPRKELGVLKWRDGPNGGMSDSQLILAICAEFLRRELFTPVTDKMTIRHKRLFGRICRAYSALHADTALHETLFCEEFPGSIADLTHDRHLYLLTDRYGIKAISTCTRQLNHLHASVLTGAGFVRTRMLFPDDEERLVSVFDGELDVYFGNEAAAIFMRKEKQLPYHIGMAALLAIDAVSSLSKGYQQTQKKVDFMMSMLPLLSNQIMDGKITMKDEIRLKNMTMMLSDIIKVLPLLQKGLLFNLMIRDAGFRKIYRKAVALCDVQDMHQQLSRNVSEINSLLEYLNSIKKDTMDNVLIAALSAAAILLVVPSFFADVLQATQLLFGTARHFTTNILSMGFLGLFAFIFAFLAFVLAGRIRRKQRLAQTFLYTGIKRKR